MLQTYVPILLMMGGAIAFAVVNIMVSNILGPHNPNPEKLSTYESGVEPIGTAHGRFSVKYYMAAMLFILFDIEIVFMYPWAVNFKDLGVEGLIKMVVFMLLLLVGFFYIIKKKALEWE